MSYLHYTTNTVQINSNTYFVQAYAKINLTLDVLGRRSDGFHELATIMQTIDLYDTLCLTATDDDDVRILCSRSELSTADNLVVRAAQMVRSYLGLSKGLLIELHKRIPVAAGLGGGSSDAAAVLLALQRWWQLPLSSEELHAMAAELGSDVAFFLTGGLAFCEGRGEHITPLAPHWPFSMHWLLLLKPAIEVSTAAVYRNLPVSDYSDGTSSRIVRSAIQDKSMLRIQDLHNSLESNVLARYPEVFQAYKHMLEAGVPGVRLSGSGPTLFAPFSDLLHAALVQQRLQEQGYEVFLTRTIFPNNEDACFF